MIAELSHCCDSAPAHSRGSPFTSEHLADSFSIRRNVGAEHKVLFVTGCALTFVTWSATLLTERWLRHIRRIPGSLHKRETRFDIVSVVFGVLGGLSLLLLSVFDAVNYKRVQCVACGPVAQNQPLT